MADERLPNLLSMIQDVTVIQRPISLSDEIYYDLRLYGDDVYDLLDEIARKYSVDFSMINVNKRVPGEGAPIVGPLLTRLGYRPYKSFTVEDLWRAIQNGRWVPSDES